uniref:Uncharacterized protein n=1 Tax=Ascaris lumbricoides TaxID=6252 RepID=A0A0M3I6G1_ASCLU
MSMTNGASSITLIGRNGTRHIVRRFHPCMPSTAAQPHGLYSISLWRKGLLPSPEGCPEGASSVPILEEGFNN